MNKLFIDIFTVTFLSILAGFLYRAGGMGKEETSKPKFIPLWARNTKTRDLGCPLCAMIILLIAYNVYTWQILLAYFISFGLYFGSLTTYWKGKAIDCKWYHWLFTGIGYSLAFLPVSIINQKWLGFFIRLFIVSIGTMLWSQEVDEVVKEEFGRGFLSTVTLPLLLI